jgi:NAD(P)-dependent dehydrogenase (short-subunit alcohol dehydrogenase family)
MARFDGRAMVVTGGGSGIGKATADRLAADGARVAVWDLDAGTAGATAESIGGVAFGCNVNDPGSVVDAARATEEQLGDVSGVVNAAGIFIVEGSVETCSVEDWDRVLGVNLRGVFLVSKALLPAIRRTTGSIVNIASLYGFRGYLDEVAYDASKGAIVNLTRQMALQYASEGVRVNAVAPGEILTPLTKAQFQPGVPEEEQIAAIAARVPMGRMGAPEEIAAVISFLMSDDASYVSGAILPVDGAFLAG